jgi:hypothetical protein
VDGGDLRGGAFADPVLLEVQVAAVGGVDARLDGVVGGGQQPLLDAEAAGDLLGDDRQGDALAQPRGAVQVDGEVAVAEREPRLVAEAGELLRDREALVGAAPLLGRVDDLAEPVGDRVEVRADPQAVQLEVVADVDDRDDVLGRGDGGEPAQEARGAHATGQYRVHARLRGRRPP